MNISSYEPKSDESIVNIPKQYIKKMINEQKAKDIFNNNKIKKLEEIVFLRNKKSEEPMDASSSSNTTSSTSNTSSTSDTSSSASDTSSSSCENITTTDTCEKPVKHAKQEGCDITKSKEIIKRIKFLSNALNNDVKKK